MTMQDFIKLTDEQHEELEFQAESLSRKVRLFKLMTEDEHEDTDEVFSF